MQVKVFGDIPFPFDTCWRFERWLGGDGGLRSPVVNHWPPTQHSFILNISTIGHLIFEAHLTILKYIRPTVVTHWRLARVGKKSFVSIHNFSIDPTTGYGRFKFHSFYSFRITIVTLNVGIDADVWDSTSKPIAQQHSWLLFCDV